MEDALEASNEYLGFSYGEEEIKRTAESVAKILISEEDNLTYDDIDRWMENANQNNDSLETSLKLQTLSDYKLNANPPSIHRL